MNKYALALRSVVAKVILMICCLLKTLLLSGQVNSFAPVGSTWYYDHTFFFGSNKNDYTKIETLGDTIIDGKLCSILYIENAAINLSSFPDSVYLNYEDGKVYRYFLPQNTWGLQYDFNAEVGDTLTCYGTWLAVLDSFKFRIDSVGFMNINGVSLRTQYYRSLSGWDYSQKVIEGIGGTAFLFATYGLEENTNYGLRCYDDDTIGHYNSGIVQDCDAVLYIGIDELEQAGIITINPTLFSNELLASNPADFDILISFFSAQNSLMKKVHLPSFQEKIIETSAWPDGPYFIRIDADQKSYVRTVVKMADH